MGEKRGERAGLTDALRVEKKEVSREEKKYGETIFRASINDPFHRLLNW